MEEKWAKIPGFSNYEINNYGIIIKIGKTKRIPIAVRKSGNYIYASLSCGFGKSKQVNVKQVMDQCFEEHIYKDSNSEDLSDEIWRDVVGWENAYQVSNLGRVRTKTHIITTKRGTTATISCKLKKTYIDDDGYLRVSLYANNKSKLVGVHRIVAEAFLPNPDNLPQVNHKNGDKADNRACNLEWVSNTSNIQHSIENGLRDPKIHSIEITCTTDSREFNSISELAKELKIPYNKLVHLFKASNGHTIVDGKEYKYKEQLDNGND